MATALSLPRIDAAPQATPPPATAGRYRTRLAAGTRDLDAVLRLRYEVFNLELGEGLASSHATGRDEDELDVACDHLMVEDAEGVVGTYRLQPFETAAAFRGFYSAGEFELATLPEELLANAVEVGRACVAPSHRNRHVLFHLWKGIASYMLAAGKRYLFGCCSLRGQDPALGLRAFEELRAGGHVHPELRVEPRQGMTCAGLSAAPDPDAAPELPMLFKTYLRHGAKVCGPPAIDRAFGTIDFFTLLDIHDVPPHLARTYFPASVRLPS